LIYEVCHWQVRRAKSRKHEAIIRELRKFIRAHRKKFYYQRSWTYKVDQKGQRETWVAVDEYRNQQAYNRMFRAYRSTGKVYVEFFTIVEKWNKLLVSHSVKIESWVEKPEFRLG
jgi:hypothetical protein